MPRLHSIVKGHIIFTGILYITIDKKTKHYYVTVSIPLTSELLVKEQEFSITYPSMLNETNTFFKYFGST